MSETTTPVKAKKNRPITFDSLRTHASNLDLESKVKLVAELKVQIEGEVARLQGAAADAHKLASALAGTLAR
jgi:hypothetical protein